MERPQKFLDRFIQGRFDIRPYLAFIKNGLIEEQKRMQNKSQYNQEIVEMVGDYATTMKGQEFATLQSLLTLFMN